MSFAVIIKMVNLKGTVDIQCSIVTKEDDVTWQGVAFYIGGTGKFTYYVQDTDGKYKSKCTRDRRW